MPVHDSSIMIVWSAAAAVVLLIMAIIWRKLSIYLHERRMRQIADLQAYSQRLRTVVAELLARANDLDQGSAYLQVEFADERENLSRRIGVACEELVRLGESLPLVDQLLEHRNLASGRQHLLHSCRTATRISNDLSAISAMETRAIDDREKNKRPKSGS